jgi:hypothetical protein
MRNKMSVLLTAVLVVAMILYTMPVLTLSVKAANLAASPPSFWVEPETESFNAVTTPVGTLFNVTVWGSTPVNDSAGLQTFAWQVNLGFNTSQLQAVKAGFTAGATSELFAGHSTIPLTPVITNTGSGSVLVAETLLAGESVGAESASLFWAEFNVTAAPSAGQTFTCNIDPGYGLTQKAGTKFLDTTPVVESGLSTAYCVYSYVSPPPVVVVHDVVVSSVSASGTVVQGLSLPVSVVVLNNGTVAESSVVVNATANGTLIGTQTVSSLLAGNTTTLSFTWSTVSVSVGSYTVTATVTPVANQTDLTGISKSITVQVLASTAKVYDIGNYGIVDIRDIAIAAAAFGSYGPNYLYPGSKASANWNPAADVNGDGTVDIMDITLIAQHFGETT